MTKARQDIRKVRAQDIMRTELVTIADQSSLSELAQLLSDHGFSGVPVTDGAGQIIGVVSVRDLIDHYAEDPSARPQGAASFYLGLSEDNWDPPAEIDQEDGVVADVMTAQLHTVASDVTLPTLARKMTELGLHRVLIEQDRRVVGMVTTLDVVRAVAELD